MSDAFKESKDGPLAAIGDVMFWSRWLLVPLYLGLMVALLAYDISYFQEMIHMIESFWVKGSMPLEMFVIDLLDVIMVANLVVMNAIGGYSIFVREYQDDDVNTHKPRWLKDITTTTQKIKMNMSLIAVSSVHLLHSFFVAETTDWMVLGKQLAVHGMFLISIIVLCIVDRMLHPVGHHSGEGH